MLTDTEALQILERSGAVIRNSHLIYTSGKHGAEYVNKDAVYPRTDLISKLCLGMAERFQADNVDIVLGPALGGIVLCQWVAHHLSALNSRNVLAVYAEKEGEGFAVRRGYDDLVRGKRVLVVEDILTTGGSVKKVVETLQKIPCEVVGVAALCNRGAITPKELGNVPKLESLVRLNLVAWNESECPLCKTGVPINRSVGKGARL